MSKTSKQIRREFIQFFEGKGHTFVPSASLLPADDPTLLFTNAGMNQFKDIFLGTGSRSYTRAVNSQKVIRAGGKHNDLEDVGHDTFHHTFFEMLGNWSFGDYFKAEAIEWAWELLTDVWGLPEDKLWVGVFGGDKTAGLEPDHEAIELWPKVTDIPAERVLPGSMKDNFWEMGETGPCGPCTEIHIDLGQSVCDGSPHPGIPCAVSVEGCRRFIELWNLVFIQYNRDATGHLEPLPAKHVDTGLGLARISAVLQGKTDNYATDIFSPLMDSLAEMTGVRYGQGDETDVALRVIADHARACTFAIADGILPSNEGRGYVIRRILRRAARFGRNLNQHEPFIHNLAAVIAEQVGDFFPEVAQRAEQVDEVILEEESSFNRTLDRGILIFERSMIDAICWKLSDERKSPTWEAERSGLIKKSTDEVPWVFKIGSEEFVLEKKADTANFVRKYCKSAPQISGPTAFELYATYGFPIDLTQLMASERGLSVDIDGYEREMENHREISRVQSTLLTSDYQQPGGKTEFCGYKDEEVEQIDTHVLATRKKERGKLTSHVLSEGDEGIVFLDKSPFYAEAGGQVGDTGIIEQDSGTFRVTDTRKEVPAPGIENYCHYGVVEKGQIQIRNKPVRRSKPPGSGKELPPPGISGDAIARVDKERRQDIARNHTATHLLNWALRKVLEGNIDQAGSVVAPERLRFDFTYSKAVTAEQLAEVERLVNGRILADEAIFTNDIPLAQAQKIPGVRAVFGEKYPDPVRVVSVAVDDPVKQGDENTLVEFCGGTHLERTSQAGFFKILSEESVAKGVRRITAVTGHQAVRHIQRLDEAVSSASSALRVPIEQISERIIAMQSEIKQLRKGRSAKQAGGGQFKPDFVVKTPEGDALIGSVDFADAGAMRKICDVQRQKGAAAILLGGTAENKVMLVAMVSESLVKTGGIKAGEWVNAAATVVGGKGGGKPTMAQAGGKDAGKLPEALKVGADWLQGKLG